jgi:BMFP domain-containing protein YqiC
MAADNRILDDLAKVAAGALGGIGGMKQEIEARLRQQFERILSGMELVKREEFEAVKAMAAKARTEQEDLAARFDRLEARFSRKRPDSGAPRGPGEGGRKA